MRISWWERNVGDWIYLPNSLHWCMYLDFYGCHAVVTVLFFCFLGVMLIKNIAGSMRVKYYCILWHKCIMSFCLISIPILGTFKNIVFWPLYLFVNVAVIDVCSCNVVSLMMGDCGAWRVVNTKYFMFVEWSRGINLSNFMYLV